MWGVRAGQQGVADEEQRVWRQSNRREDSPLHCSPCCTLCLHPSLQLLLNFLYRPTPHTLPPSPQPLLNFLYRPEHTGSLPPTLTLSKVSGNVCAVRTAYVLLVYRPEHTGSLPPTLSLSKVSGIVCAQYMYCLCMQPQACRQPALFAVVAWIHKQFGVIELSFIAFCTTSQ